jgi:hypothetical protein
MMYAVQSNVVRWFFNEVEINYLFNKVKIKSITPPNFPSIVINGNWKKGYAFRPVISRNSDSVSHFPIVAMADNLGGEIYHFATPAKILNISQNELATLTSADVLASPATDGRHALIVYPAETRPKLNLNCIVRPEASSRSIVQVKSTVATSEETTVVTADKQTLIQHSTEIQTTVENDIPQSTNIDSISTSQVAATDNEQVAWAKLLVDQINADLVTIKGITPIISEDGKSIRFMRVVKKRQEV